ISARTKDETTRRASERLFRLADTPGKITRLSVSDIEKAIYPAGFYRTKAKSILSLCDVLLEKFGGKVPETLEELMTLKGVGRKTANLVITLAFRKKGICVDTHVHRISNRWGLVRTRAPEETEFALYKVLPQEYWIEYNDLLVAFGQNICNPVSPRCSVCRLNAVCPKIGVRVHR
ncbi:MAG TPA: endonuclease III, partial [Candidatus Omnitrophota bacterium]|nr:endonuclease III [Candidatus Omnitrophota bacterium]